MARDLRQQRGRIVAADKGRDAFHQPDRVAAGHAVKDLGAQQIGGAVFHFRELGADAGLQRKAAQQRGAERMDRLDAQAAGRLDGAGKQRAGVFQKGAVGAVVQPKLLQRLCQPGGVQHGPGAQPLEQPVLHLGCGGLGVGQAQDVFGRHTQ